MKYINKCTLEEFTKLLLDLKKFFYYYNNPYKDNVDRIYKYIWKELNKKNSIYKPCDLVWYYRQFQELYYWYIKNINELKQQLPKTVTK